MATPLSEVLGAVINDPTIRAEFAAGPETFLAGHGYAELDGADVREALYILADGSPSAEAEALSGGGDAIDGLDAQGLAGAAAGLSLALAALTGEPDLVGADPADLDGLDDGFGDGPEAHQQEVDNNADTDTGDDDDDGEDVPTAEATDEVASSAAPDEESAEPVLISPDDAVAVDVQIDLVDPAGAVPPLDTSTTTVDDDAGDGWDDLI